MPTLDDENDEKTSSKNVSISDATMKPIQQDNHHHKSLKEEISWWEHNPTLKTLVATLSVSFGSAILTYPAQLMKMEWQQTALSKWTTTTTTYNNNGIEFYQLDKRRWNFQATIKPLLRLVLNELALASLGSGAPQFSEEILAGSMAGLSQALIICPLEAYSATKQMNSETKMILEEKKKKWWLPQTWIDNHTMEPRDRLVRAYKGVGVMAVREVIFNATFFPMYHWFLQTHQHPIPSAVMAGSICAQLVTPLDVWSTYMMHSRTTWHWWSGRKLQAPPIQLLFRGISLQALVFGPCFGLVAAVYQLT